ncbi:MAG: hypothetical protein IPI46_04775 [Bacteroidetes bacterium]|nr:hypothetical protein [Bacteroidota bacterium]
MKKISLTVLTLFFIVANGFSQDTISKRSNEFILAKVLAVTATEIKYKKFDNLHGPTATVRKFDVICIHYENGKIDSFDYVNPLEVVTTSGSPGRASFNQDQMNDSRNNKRYKGARKGKLLEEDTKDSFNYVDSNTSITTKSLK